MHSAAHRLPWRREVDLTRVGSGTRSQDLVSTDASISSPFPSDTPGQGLIDQEQSKIKLKLQMVVMRIFSLCSDVVNRKSVQDHVDENEHTKQLYQQHTAREGSSVARCTGTWRRVTSGGNLLFTLALLIQSMNPMAQSTFTVADGPCQVRGFCVGRPDGFLVSERCTIYAPIGRQTTISRCPIFDTGSYSNRISISYRGSYHNNCPSGVPLSPGEEITWESSYASTGMSGWEICVDPSDRCNVYPCDRS